MEDLLRALVWSLVCLQVLRRPVAGRSWLLLGVGLLAFGAWLDVADEVPAWRGVPLLGRGGVGHELVEDLVGGLGGALATAWWLLRHGLRRNG